MFLPLEERIFTFYFLPLACPVPNLLCPSSSSALVLWFWCGDVGDFLHNFLPLDGGG